MDKDTDKPDKPLKPRGWLESLNCAIEGVIYAFKTQRHIRYHYVLAVLALFLSLVLRLPPLEFVLFAITVVMLLFAEMMNTAIEETVNLVEDKYNVTAKNAKDVSAGAVLISSIAVVMMGYVIFSRYLYGPTGSILKEARMHSGDIAFISLILVLIAVVAIKAAAGKGTPLHGGLPSGHAALGFALWTGVTLITLDPMVSAMAFALAVMVSQSRLLGGIHTLREVLLGALLGSGVMFLIFYLFSTILPIK